MQLVGLESSLEEEVIIAIMQEEDEVTSLQEE